MSNVSLWQNIIHSSGSVQDEMAHYLYVLQSVTLNLQEPRMRTPLDCCSQVSRNTAGQVSGSSERNASGL